VPSGDPELTRHLDSIDARIDDIGRQLHQLRWNLAAHGIVGNSVADLLHVIDGHRVLVVGPDVDGIVDELQAACASGSVHRIEAASSLDNLIANSPYDAILITEPVHRVAWAWVQHTRRGGVIACVLDPNATGGRPVVLTRDDGEASGRFLTTGVGPLRSSDPVLDRPLARDPGRHARYGRTTLPLQLWRLRVPWFLATGTMPDVLRIGAAADTTILEAPDGSWCQLTDGADGYRYVIEGGPLGLFRLFAETYDRWDDAGRPGLNQVHVTVTPDRHVLALEGTLQRWELG